MGAVRLFGAILLLAAGLAPGTVRAEDAAKFYKDKDIRLIIGADVGGPYDAYGRLLGRYIGRHIPGNPRVVVQNMPGATAVIAANYVYNKAPQDGTVLATLTNVIPLTKVLGEIDTQFDPAKLNWIGNMAHELYTVYVRSTSPIMSLADARRTKVTMGATSLSAMSSIYPRIINNVAGTQFKVVTGYPGMAAVENAMERGEVDGIAGDSWYDGHGSGVSFNWYRNGTIRTIALVGSKRPPEFAGVPRLVDLAKDDETKQLLELFSSPAQVGKPVVMGPDVPADRVATMRRAFDATVADRDFLTEAEKLKLAIDPEAGEQLSGLVRAMMAKSAAIAPRAREIAYQ
jgi:tripartite-type tricarboxylate transporter receptor subunit TctC